MGTTHSCTNHSSSRSSSVQSRDLERVKMRVVNNQRDLQERTRNKKHLGIIKDKKSGRYATRKKRRLHSQPQLSNDTKTMLFYYDIHAVYARYLPIHIYIVNYPFSTYLLMTYIHSERPTVFSRAMYTSSIADKSSHVK